MNGVLERRGKIILVDDEPQILSSASAILVSEGFADPLCICDSREVISLMSGQKEGIAEQWLSWTS
ncbi:MAG: hypothetical protein ABSB95_09600 [Dissulfurispiraceae bacterium]|jgi:hypothetical protein